MTMTARFDRKGSADRLPPFPPAPPGETAVQRKTRLLTATRTRKALARVARSRGVPADKVDDVVQETLVRAWKATLPEDDAEAQKYVNGIAFRVACEMMGASPLGTPESYVETPDEEEGEAPTPAAVEPASFEARDGIEKLMKAGQAKFPTGFAGFVEARMTQQTAEEAARTRGVSNGHMRKEWSDIQHFVRKHGRKIGLLGVLLVLGVVLPRRFWLAQPIDTSGWRQYDAKVRHNPPPPDAAALRARGQKECLQGAWQACLDDFEAAEKLDPDGETVEQIQIRLTAWRNVVHPDAAEAAPQKDLQQFDAKPPLR